MSYPLIVWNPGSTPEEAVELPIKRGPVNYACTYEGRIHDNLATSGKVRERVIENLDMIITFELPHLVVGDDFDAWTAFMRFALAGGVFQFNYSASEYCNPPRMAVRTVMLIVPVQLFGERVLQLRGRFGWEVGAGAERSAEVRRELPVSRAAG